MKYELYTHTMSDKNTYAQLADDQVIARTSESLKANGINSVVVDSAEEAKEKVLEMLPEGSEVFTSTSMTLTTAGIDEAINGSDKYKSVRNELTSLDREKDSLKMQKLGSAPEYVVGSVHAVTEDGKVVIASNTGSQLPSYAYGSSHVIWVVGTQKIVKDLSDAEKRIYEYVLDLESDRARKAYGMPHSFVSKLLIINREIKPDRITIIFVKEQLGF
jgi:L-lactate utilization protein LutB